MTALLSLVGGAHVGIDSRFDYSILDQETAKAIRKTTASIRSLSRSIGRDIIGIGLDLIKVKQRIGHGHFGEWLSAEFDWTERTARNYIRASDDDLPLGLPVHSCRCPRRHRENAVALASTSPTTP